MEFPSLVFLLSNFTNMGLPGHRRTSGDKRRRAAQHGLDAINPAICPKCDKTTLPHRACAFCGTYRGRQVVDVAKRAARTVRKTKKK